MTSGISGYQTAFQKFPVIGEQVRKISAALSAIEAGSTLDGGFLPYAFAAKCLLSKPEVQRDPQLQTALLALSQKVQIAYAKTAPRDLLRAIRDNDPKRCDQIIAASGIANKPLSNGEMPLHYAIRYGSRDVVADLLQKALANPLTKDHQGLTAFDHAFLTEDLEMASLVLGASLGRTIPVSLLTSAAVSEQEVKQLAVDLKTLRNPPVSLLPPLSAAAFMGDLKELQALSRAEDPRKADQTGMTALHYAVLGGNDEAVLWLLRKGCKLDGKMANGMTLLHLAAISGSETVLKLLLAGGRLNPNAADQRGRTPLHFAIAADQLNCARALVDKGADPMAATMKTTPFAILKTFSQIRAESRDPLRLDMPAVWTFGTYAGSALCGALSGSDSLKDYMGLKSTLERIGHFLHAVPVFKTIFSKMTGGQVQSYPAIAAFPYAIHSYLTDARTGKSLLEGAQAGFMLKRFADEVKVSWKNSSVETYRPLRNLFVHAGNALFGTWSALQTSGLKKHIVCAVLDQDTCLLQDDLNPKCDLAENMNQYVEKVKEKTKAGIIRACGSDTKKCAKAKHSLLDQSDQELQEAFYKTQIQPSLKALCPDGNAACEAAHSPQLLEALKEKMRECLAYARSDAELILRQGGYGSKNDKGEDISAKKAFRSLGITYHPDKCKGRGEEACTTVFQKLDTAYNTVSLSGTVK